MMYVYYLFICTVCLLNKIIIYNLEVLFSGNNNDLGEMSESSTAYGILICHLYV